MPKLSFVVRVWITAGVLLLGNIMLHAMSHGEKVVAHEPLQKLPYSIGDWGGKDLPIEQRIVRAVSVDDYASRAYTDPEGRLVQLYVGFYQTQRTGDTIHSPKNCLPGAGWDPIRSGQATIPLPDGRQITVNEYVIQQGPDRQLVFYWYQGRGRVIASEYWGKFWMVADALTRNRTDGALVRLNTPVKDDEESARHRLIEFSQKIFPYLSEFIPN